MFPTRIGDHTLNAVSSLGEDANSEIYIVDIDEAGGTLIGSVYKIVRGH